MKKYIYNLFIVAIVSMGLVSCTVDGYEVANDAVQLDAPAGYLNDADLMSGDAITETDISGDTWTYLPQGGSVTYTIKIVDAPGLIDSVSVRLSNSLRPLPFGTYTVNLEASKGQEKGLVSVTYTAGVDAGEENIEITVWDNQDPRKSETHGFPTIKIADTDCFPTKKNLIGFYDAVTSGFDGVAGANYTDLEAVVELYYRSSNHPGLIRITDGSFGLYSEQDFGPVRVNVELCDGNILSALSADDEFSTFTGTINADGSMNITWENIYGDTGTTVLTPQ